MASLFNMLTSIMCYTSSIKLGEDILIVNNRPLGNCLLCCKINETNDIQYILYTRNLQEGVKLPYGDPGEAARYYGADPDNPTIIFLHGFSEIAPGASSIAIKDAYLEIGDFNIILVNWSRLVAFPWYRSATKNARIMGKNLAKFLLKLDYGGLPIEKVHVIGFSLGAAAAGFAGKSMPKDKKIPRITGLDPAFPLYFFNSRDERLADGDAEFVDVIHTDAGILGFPTPMGDADFYPNGGLPLQPGCRASEIVRVWGFNIAKYVSCSHQRAWQYYAESIRNPEGFPATRCARWIGPYAPCNFTIDNYMGAGAQIGLKGRFFLQTNEASPFSLAVS